DEVVQRHRGAVDGELLLTPIGNLCHHLPVLTRDQNGDAPVTGATSQEVVVVSDTLVEYRCARAGDVLSELLSCGGYDFGAETAAADRADDPPGGVTTHGDLVAHRVGLEATGAKPRAQVEATRREEHLNAAGRDELRVGADAGLSQRELLRTDLPPIHEDPKGARILGTGLAGGARCRKNRQNSSGQNRSK